MPFDGLKLNTNEPASFCAGTFCETDTGNETAMHCECGWQGGKGALWWCLWGGSMIEPAGFCGGTLCEPDAGNKTTMHCRGGLREELSRGWRWWCS